MVLENSLIDLLTPAQAAEELNVNVTTLRKYSLIIEKVTANDSFFARKNNKRRNYTQKNIADIKKMIKKSKQTNMTLETAAEELFDGKMPDKEIEKVISEEMTDNERNLSKKISKQLKEIKHLKKQLKDSQQENYALIRALKKTQETPLFDYDMNVNEEIIPEQQKQIEDITKEEPKLKKDFNYTEEIVDKKYEDTLKRAKEIRDKNNELVKEKEFSFSQPKTLSSMQIEPKKKKKWWKI